MAGIMDKLLSKALSQKQNLKVRHSCGTHLLWDVLSRRKGRNDLGRAEKSLLGASSILTATRSTAFRHHGSTFALPFRAALEATGITVKIVMTKNKGS